MAGLPQPFADLLFLIDRSWMVSLSLADTSRKLIKSGQSGSDPISDVGRL